MLTLHGTVMNTVAVPETKVNGQTRGGYSQVQMLCEESLQAGGHRLQLHTFTTNDLAPWERLKGSRVGVPVGVYVKDGALRFFLRPGAVQAEG